MSTYKQIRSFIERNRQTGSTTTLVDAVLKTDGILVVHSTAYANELMKKYPALQRHNIVSVNFLDDFSVGKGPRQIFFDAAVFCASDNRNKNLFSRVYSFLYLMMRDAAPVGHVFSAVKECSREGDNDDCYTNKELQKIAERYAAELLGDERS